jgi:transcriptional regulator with XRE-family HTH domain
MKGTGTYLMRNLNLLKTIGNELRNIRKVKGINLKEVAEQAGVSTMYISEIERDKKAPSDEVIEKLSEIYKVNEIQLYEGFRRIPEVMFNEIINHSDLFEVIYKMATNPNITDEQKKEIYAEIKTKYDTMFTSE